jgi:hypothetical protein
MHVYRAEQHLGMRFRTRRPGVPAVAKSIATGQGMQIKFIMPPSTHGLNPWSGAARQLRRLNR